MFQFSFVWPSDRSLSGATNLGQIGLGSFVNVGVICITQSFSITRTSPSDCLASYQGHSFVGSYSLVKEFYFKQLSLVRV